MKSLSFPNSWGGGTDHCGETGSDEKDVTAAVNIQLFEALSQNIITNTFACSFLFVSFVR